MFFGIWVKYQLELIEKYYYYILFKCLFLYIGDVNEYSINNDICCIQIFDCKLIKYVDDY